MAEDDTELDERSRHGDDDRDDERSEADEEEPEKKGLDPAPIAAKLEDLGKALPGAAGGPHTPPSEADAPIPP